MKENLWEENDLTELRMKSENNGESVLNGSTNDTKKSATKNDLNDTSKQKKKNYYKEWCLKNKDSVRRKYKEWYLKNKIKVRQKQKIYWKENQKEIKKWLKSYRKLNKDKILEQQIKWKKVNKDNLQYKISCRLRERLGDAVKNNYKSGSAVKNLGCSVSELKRYLESKFQPGMTWDNWSLKGWHIDHIKPLSSFDLTDRKQLFEAVHYTNLQPLWANENLSKGNKIVRD